jgi:transposase-like protein/DNA-directed RNA polymerase subunit RPC12/RpoP
VTIIPKIKCPRCSSSKLYKFGKDPYGYQKYQCKLCKRQFAPFSPQTPRKLKGYPKCPKCGKARKISQFLFMNNAIKVSHVTIASWAKMFAPLFQTIASNLQNSINLYSDEWHADETVIKINGKKYYIWFVIDSETRFVISFHLSPYRSSPQAFRLFGNAGKYGTPNAVVTDRYWPYNTAVKVFSPNSKHIKVQSFKDDISNNIIESFNDTFKSWYKSKRGFGSFTSANNLIATFIFFYNFIRPHSSLNNLAPAQVAGANYNDKDRCNWILTA